MKHDNRMHALPNATGEGRAGEFMMEHWKYMSWQMMLYSNGCDWLINFCLKR